MREHFTKAPQTLLEPGKSAKKERFVVFGITKQGFKTEKVIEIIERLIEKKRKFLTKKEKKTTN